MILIGFLLFLKIVFSVETASIHLNVNYMEPGNVITFNPRNLHDYNLQIYCYRGKPKYIIHVWQTISLQINSSTDNYVQYDGATPEEVQKKYVDHLSSWSVDFFSWKRKSFKLDPFNQSCVGIDSRERYSVHLNVIRVDYWKIVLLVTGTFIFLCAEKLSKNTVFYYLCGVLFGICASFLILIYFISKFFPRKPMMYGVVIGGWTVGIYLLQLLWENIRMILSTYQVYVLWYILIIGCLSFVVCYRFGPVTNERTRNLIRWMLKGLGLLMIFFSSQFQEAAMGQIVILFLTHNFPKSWVNKSKLYWKKKFPPKVKLLSNDEYYHEGVRETTKALEELRQYCSSPECNQWKTVLKLKDVKRFASFVEGNSHLSDDEILEYESSIQVTELTDDDEEMMTDEEEEN